VPTRKIDRKFNRRELLQAAGGITFLALTRNAEGLFESRQKPFDARHVHSPLPVFTAPPYLQPGQNGSKLTPGEESIVIAWQTNGVHADYKLVYGATTSLNKTATITSAVRSVVDDEDGQQRTNYIAELSELDLNRRYQYRVSMNGGRLAEGYFTTRKPRSERTRFVAFGDNSCGEVSDHAIAYYAYRARPDFVMNAGDNVYDNGLDSEYARYFFNVYNADVPGPRIGAPLLRSVPFYSVLANHDATSHDGQKRNVADFDRHPDALGYYTNLHLPLNGPVPNYPTIAVGKADGVDRFKACASGRYPNMANYSFDYGDGHFLCLDSNVYTDPTDAGLQEWIASDLSATDAAWKFVTYHHPGFTGGKEHYNEQQMRVLAPIFEKHHIDIVISGHVHNYQRSRPMRFAPANVAGAKKVHTGDRKVPGEFTVDRLFDGEKQTKPDGVIHIITGAGGNELYDPECNNSPLQWTHAEDNHADYVAKFVSDRHSFTLIDMDAHTLRISQIDEWGGEVDRWRLTKS